MGVMDLRRRIMLNEPHIVTTTPAGIANFSTDMIAPLKSCKVAFSPVQSGSGDPSPDNVRPISGWTGCEVRNAEECHMFIPLSGTSWTQNGITIDYLGNGKYHVYGKAGNNQSSYIVPCEEFTIPSGEGRLLELHNNINAGEIYIFFQYNYGAVDSWRLTPINRTHSTFITMAGEKANQLYFNFAFSQPTVVDFTIRPLFIKNATTTIPIDWTTEAGTVYGGSLDITTGLLTVGMAMIDIGTAGFGYVNSVSNPYFQLFTRGAVESKRQGFCLTSIGLKVVPRMTGSTTDDYAISLTDTGYIRIRDTNYSDISAFNSGMSGVQLVYELATPVAYQLTPAQLKSLRGMNNIWSDANGDTTVKYWTH